MLLSCAAHPLIRHVQMYGQNNRTKCYYLDSFSVCVYVTIRKSTQMFVFSRPKPKTKQTNEKMTQKKPRTHSTTSNNGHCVSRLTTNNRATFVLLFFRGWIYVIFQLNSTQRKKKQTIQNKHRISIDAKWTNNNNKKCPL